MSNFEACAFSHARTERIASPAGSVAGSAERSRDRSRSHGVSQSRTYKVASRSRSRSSSSSSSSSTESSSSSSSSSSTESSSASSSSSSDDETEKINSVEVSEREDLDDEYDEEENEDDDRPTKKKRKNSRVHDLFIQEAEVDDESEDNEASENKLTATEIDERRSETNLWGTLGEDGIKEYVSAPAKPWVRLTRGLYKDDIAQVHHVDIPESTVYLKLLPRTDYAKPRCALRTDRSELAITKRKKNWRPAAKPFDPEAIRAVGGKVTSAGDFLIFDGDNYSHNGFLFKNFAISAIIAEDVKPTLSELEKFDEREKLPVKITSIDENIIAVPPKHEKLKEVVEFQENKLRKYIKIGDHVKVVAGRYEGNTGLIVQVEPNRVVLFTDLSMHQLEVLPRDLQLCSDTATGADSHGQLQWGDLLQLDPQTVGVIVQLERENLHVLSMNGKVVQVKPQEVKKRQVNRNTIALDSQRNTIQRKDIVKVVHGPHSGRTGAIKHLYRNFCFLYSMDDIKNDATFVCRTRHTQLFGGSNNRASNEAGSTRPTAMLPMHPKIGNESSTSSNINRNNTSCSSIIDWPMQPRAISPLLASPPKETRKKVASRAISNSSQQPSSQPKIHRKKNSSSNSKDSHSPKSTEVNVSEKRPHREISVATMVRMMRDKNRKKIINLIHTNREEYSKLAYPFKPSPFLACIRGTIF